MITYQQLLAATDLSPEAARAADRAAALAAASQGTLDLLHVARYSGLDQLEGLVRAMPRHTCDLIHQQAQATLDAFATAVCRHHDISITTCVAEGPLVPAIHARAARIAADLVVVGARGAGEAGGALLGVTAGRLIDSLESSLLVVRRDPAAGYRRVLVPVDLSTRSVESLEVARRVAPGAELVVLHASEEPAVHARRRMEAVCAPARAMEPSDQQVLAQIAPARWTLEQEARNGCDLIVLLRQHVEMIERALLGPGTRLVLSNARPDVLVVRTPVPRSMRGDPEDLMCAAE